MHQSWYQTFFDDTVVEFWRRISSPEQTRAESEFAVQELRLSPPARVLDIPCGHGRHAVELARRGYQVVGVDISPAALGLAAQGAADAGTTVAWRQTNMADWDSEERFDGALCMGNSFGYLEPALTRRFLSKLAAALKSDARVLIDSGASAETLLPNLQPTLTYTAGDIAMRVANHYNPALGRLETRYTFERDGERFERMSWQWVHTVGEITRMLADVNLRVVGLHASLDREAYVLGSRRLLLVAAKRSARSVVGQLDGSPPFVA